MKTQLPPFEAGRVLVVGDVMLDRYLHGATSRISPEAPVPVVRVEDDEERPGGAGNVALNVAALGGGAELLCVTGEDPAAQSLAEHLSAAGVNCLFQRLAGYATITKLRVLSRHQQLIRLDFEDGFPGFDHAALVAAFTERLPEAGAVVLSDYGKGTLRPARELIDAARALGKPVLVDPKSRDFSIYRGATVITPNLSEFEAVVGPCAHEADLVAKGNALMREHQFEALLITRGEHGMTLLREGQPELHLPTRAREVYDVTGAGDTVISVLAAALAAGQDLPTATVLANTAAGVVVGKLGAATVSVLELRRALQEEHEVGTGVVSEDQLLLALEDARAHGERIVMTNGCFDILHAGHVRYLEEARRLGDRLVVAVNTDDSVRKLKGPGRPVNAMDRRMAVLAALASVDWVVSFSEDTPERLICRMAPDYLVKGGDNRPDDIPGGKCVREQGGQVLVMSYLDGCSTTKIIGQIQGDGA